MQNPEPSNASSMSEGDVSPYDFSRCRRMRVVSKSNSWKRRSPRTPRPSPAHSAGCSSSLRSDVFLGSSASGNGCGGRKPISEVLLPHPRHGVQQSVPGDRLAKGWPSSRVRTGRPEQEQEGVIWWRWTQRKQDIPKQSA